MTDSTMALRGVFDEAAELYDRARPGYPDLLFDDLAELAGAGPGCHLLEIGPGTGKATRELARLGCHITTVELGPNLAAVAARNLAAYADVQVVVSSFETWPLPAQPFDVVLAATAYHWLDPAVRVAKVAQALRPGGVLAVVETHHVAGGDEGFFVDVQDCYLRWDPTTTPGHRPPTVTDVPETAETDQSGLFEPALFRRHEWDKSYATAEYIDLLLTYSNHRAMPQQDQAGLLGCVADLIDNGYRGRITKRYLTQLWTARRLA